MPRPRFTLRWLMVAVAIVAVIVWGVRLQCLSAANSAMAEDWSRDVASLRKENSVRPDREVERLMVHCVAMLAKYKRASRYPWLAVAPRSAGAGVRRAIES
jgi:hypothetical protein